MNCIEIEPTTCFFYYYLVTDPKIHDGRMRNEKLRECCILISMKILKVLFTMDGRLIFELMYCMHYVMLLREGF